MQNNKKINKFVFDGFWYAWFETEDRLFKIVKNHSLFRNIIHSIKTGERK